MKSVAMTALSLSMTASAVAQADNNGLQIARNGTQASAKRPADYFSVTAGAGRVQRSGDAMQKIRPGDVVWIPPGQKHWHGDAPTTAMTHIAITELSDGNAVDWLEKVSDTQYGSQP